MRAVFTVPEAIKGAVGCDARYAGAGPGHLHLNVCVCGRTESIAGRMSGAVVCAGEKSAKLPRGRVGKSVGSKGYIASYGRNPLWHLGMSRGDEGR